jgi:hypothetical protein
MLTNLTQIKTNAATAARRPFMGMRATALPAICLGSLPTYIFVGGRVQRHGQNNESQRFSDRRQNQF